ncbi:hypothetical protein BKA82DRAFT_1006846 [Pisolithus tinctorius]|uniref:Uncharacterized protein n=1 Tax=Pisolithus tinctorius Marx 270 TaxID=870435 RepID=A0A0C3NL52_PISTI|nr:hypothetical protein BKA82DRAFT_1006846 [Pisolithus tinctorius]KIN96340.1 hypothetical protein M404DRAFT_1006846 [Pisolithus tinctorius Marx 270]
MDVNKKCKSLEAHVYDPSLPVSAHGKMSVGNSSSNPTDKGKSKSGWTVVQDRPQASSAPKPTSELPLSELFQTFHLPSSKGAWFPPSYFSPELPKRSTPSPPPSPFHVIVTSLPRANSPRLTSPTPPSVAPSSPALSARSSFTSPHEDWDDIDRFYSGNGPAQYPYQGCQLAPPSIIPSPPPLPPLPTSCQIRRARRSQDPNFMSDHELNLLIERRQRDIERTQLQISRMQSEISHAIADITEWVAELRHRK